MANDLDTVVPQLLAQGLKALRENSITPRLVNSTYSALAGQRGSTIDVPIPGAITAVEVAPANIAPNPADITTGSRSIPMDQWYEASFYLTDREMHQVVDGFIPLQALSAVKAIANNVDNYLLGFYKKFYGYSANSNGAFADGSGGYNVQDATTVRKILNEQLAPLDDRWFVMDPAAEANALNVRAFQDMSFHGDARAILEGDIRRRLGFAWAMNQNIPSHTAGTVTGTISTDSGGHAVGATSITVDAGSGEAIALKEGDIVTFAGDSQTYVVTADLTVGASASGALGISPPLQVAQGGAVNLTVVSTGTQVQNLAFHRDAIGFATRPLERHSTRFGIVSESMPDPISGLTLRLEVKLEHKRLRWSFDMLYGAAVLRPEFGARLAV